MDPTIHKASVFSQDTCIDSERGRQWDVRAHDASLSIVPPYWQHRRYESFTSVDIIRPPAIVLEDHTEDEPECSSPLWAKAVSLEDYMLVSGSFASVGDYIVWSCKIDTIDVGVALLSFHCLLASSMWSTVLSADVGWIDHNQKEVSTCCPSPPRAWLNRDRYSEFQDLRRKLLITFPNAGPAMPPLPPKSLIRESFHLRAYHHDG